MDKGIKIFLSVLALVSIGFSLAFYFEWGPFAQRVETPSKEQPGLIRTLDNVIRKITRRSPPTSTSSIIEETPEESCIVLDDQFCGQGKLVYDQNNLLVGLGFKLPEGTKIYAPFDSRLEQGNIKFQIENRLYQALSLINMSKEYLGQNFRTFFAVLGKHQPETDSQDFKKGDFFASVRDLLVDETLGDYNLIFNFRVYSSVSNEWYTDINLLGQFFDIQK